MGFETLYHKLSSFFLQNSAMDVISQWLYPKVTQKMFFCLVSRLFSSFLAFLPQKFSHIQVTPFDEKSCHIESSGTLSSAALLHLESSPHTTDTVLYKWYMHIHKSTRGLATHGSVKVLTGDTVIICFNHVQNAKSVFLHHSKSKLYIFFFFTWSLAF